MSTREELAAYAHDAWAEWMKYVFSECTQHKGGGMLIPAYLVRRWRKLTDTPYADLFSNEKLLDRGEADKILAIVASILTDDQKATLRKDTA